MEIAEATGMCQHDIWGLITFIVAGEPTEGQKKQKKKFKVKFCFDISLCFMHEMLLKRHNIEFALKFLAIFAIA